MVRNVILPLVFLTVSYGALIWGLIWLLRRARLPLRPAISLGFLCFGTASAWLAAWIWPTDSSLYLNVWAVFLGDWLYQWSSESLGDPWLLQVPQVYLIAAVILYGGLGLLAQETYARFRPGQNRGRIGRNSLDSTRSWRKGHGNG